MRYLRLPVLDRQLHRDPQPLPVARGLGDVIAHLLGGLRDDTWRSHRARIRAESPSAAPRFFSVCRTAEHPFCRMEQHRPRTYFIPPSQGPLQFPRDSLIPPPGHASHPLFPRPRTCFHSARDMFHPSPPCPRSSKSPRPRYVPAPGVRSWGPARTWLRPRHRCSAGKLRGQRRVSRARRPHSPRPPPAPAARHVPTLISLGSNLGGIAAADGGDGGGWKRMETDGAQKEHRDLSGAVKRQRVRRGPLIYSTRSRESTGITNSRLALATGEERAVAALLYMQFSICLSIYLSTPVAKCGLCGRVVWQWQGLPRAPVESPALNVSKEGPSVALSALGCDEAGIRPRMDSVIPGESVPFRGPVAGQGGPPAAWGRTSAAGRALWAGRSSRASRWCR